MLRLKFSLKHNALLRCVRICGLLWTCISHFPKKLPVANTEQCRLILGIVGLEDILWFMTKMKMETSDFGGVIVK